MEQVLPAAHEKSTEEQDPCCSHGGHHSRAGRYTLKDCGSRKGHARARTKYQVEEAAKKSCEGLITDSTAGEARIKNEAEHGRKGK